VRVRLALCSLVAVAVQEADEPPRARPNVLLVTIDTLRADRLGCYGRATPPRRPRSTASLARACASSGRTRRFR
jgi:arylsulfatase A-like enzyme